ncbi:hypothetical protein JB92DRAFT_2843726 [Gautieria morchelliformis]|nr:hypothetical protein JB92DRAFT_2843726 [Gautieria morchelliformis]
MYSSCASSSRSTTCRRPCDASVLGVWRWMLPLIAFSAASVPCAGATSGPRLLYGATPFVCAFRGGGVWRRLCSIIFAVCHSFRFLV